MLDLKSLLKEYSKTQREIVELENELNKKQKMKSALRQLIAAMGGTADVIDGDTERVELYTIGPGPSLIESIQKAIPASGVSFGVSDIYPLVTKYFPTIKEKAVSYALWQLSQKEQLNVLEKGRRGTPARYARP